MQRQRPVALPSGNWKHQVLAVVSKSRSRVGNGVGETEEQQAKQN
jgi:hypothetical protein